MARIRDSEMKIRVVVFAKFLKAQYASPFEARILPFRAPKGFGVENGAAWGSRDIDGSRRPSEREVSESNLSIYLSRSTSTPRSSHRGFN
jgi:hypothetical protein